MLSEQPPGTPVSKGPGGSTPLMYAVLYGDADAVRLPLDNGADPNLRNEAGASALMWAVDNLEKTRVLLQRGADVNARSPRSRTDRVRLYSNRGQPVWFPRRGPAPARSSGADPAVKSRQLHGGAVDSTPREAAGESVMGPLCGLLIEAVPT